MWMCTLALVAPTTMYQECALTDEMISLSIHAHSILIHTNASVRVADARSESGMLSRMTTICPIIMSSEDASDCNMPGGGGPGGGGGGGEP